MESRRSWMSTKAAIIFVVLGVAVIGGVIGMGVRKKNRRLEEEARLSLKKLDQQIVAKFEAENRVADKVDDQTIKEIEKLLDRLAKDTDPRPEKYWDQGRMSTEIDRNGEPPPLKGAERAEKSFNHVKGVLSRLKSEFVLDCPDVRSARWIVNGRDVVVTVQHWTIDVNTGESRSSRLRWWVYKSVSNWRIYDFEEVSIPGRTTADLAFSLLLASGAGLHPIFGELNAVKQAREECERGEYRAALKRLSAVHLENAPEHYGFVPPFIRATARLKLEQYDLALAEADRADRAYPKAPCIDIIRCQAHLGKKEFDEAIKYGRRYVEKVDNETNANILIARAYLGKNDPDNAIIEIEKALVEDRESYAAVCELMNALKLRRANQDRTALRTAVRNMTLLSRRAMELARHALTLEDMASVETIADVVKSKLPQSIEADMVNATVSLHRKDLKSWATSFDRCLSKSDVPEIRGKYLKMTAKDIVKLKCELGAYTQCPPVHQAKLFHRIACELDESPTPGNPTKAGDNSSLLSAEPNVISLRALIAKRHLDDPDDVTLLLHRGRLAMEFGHFERATKMFLAGERQAQERDMIQDYRNHFLWAMKRMGKEVEAYQQIKPSPREFAYLVADPIDDDKIEKLLELHVKQHPADVHLLIHRTNLEYKRKNWEAAARSGEKLRKAIDEMNAMELEERGVEPFTGSYVRQRLARCQIHLKNYPEARALIQSLRDYEEPFLADMTLAMLHGAMGKVDEFSATIEEIVKEYSDHQFLYQDPEVAALLGLPNMKSVRDRFPPAPELPQPRMVESIAVNALNGT